MNLLDHLPGSAQIILHATNNFITAFMNTNIIPNTQNYGCINTLEDSLLYKSPARKYHETEKLCTFLDQFRHLPGRRNRLLQGTPPLQMLPSLVTLHQLYVLPPKQHPENNNVVSSAPSTRGNRAQGKSAPMLAWLDRNGSMGRRLLGCLL